MVSTEQKIKILVVDDSPIQREYLAQLLIDREYDVFVAKNGTEGLSKAFEILPDIVVSDIVMPEMNGYMMCRLLKNEEITSQIPVILLSSLNDEKQRFWGLKCGADAYVAKGREKEEIPPLIEKLCFTNTAVTWEKKPGGQEGETKPDNQLSKLMDKLLLESTVYLESINLFNLIYNTEQLLEQFFSLLSRMVEYNHAVLLIMMPDKPTLHIHSQGKLAQSVLEKIKTFVIAENKLTGQEEKLAVIPFQGAIEKNCPEAGGIKSDLCVQLRKGLGSISIHSATPNFYNESTASAIHLLSENFSAVIELMLSYQKAQLQAAKDIMTGLYNWNYLNMGLEREITSHSRYGTKISLAMVSIDLYEILMNTFGRRRGEMVLRQVGEVLKKNLREADLIAHYRQERFAILFPQTDLDEAWKSLERLRVIVEEKFTPNAQRPFKLTISIGVAEFNGQVTNKDQLIDNAIASLKRASNKGGNRVEKLIPPIPE